MPDSVHADIAFGVSEHPRTRFRDVETGRFRRLDEEALLALHAELSLLTDELRQALWDEWVAGGHEHGNHSIEELEIHGEGLERSVDVPDPFWRVQTGWDAHGPVYAKALHFFTTDNVEVFTAWVEGYDGDDFIGRAKQRLNVERSLRRLATNTFAGFHVRSLSEPAEIAGE